MHQRETVRRAWEQTGIFKQGGAKAEAFLRAFDEPAACWPDLASRFRQCCPALKGKAAMAIWNTGDKLLRLNLARNLDPKQKDELEILRKLVRSARVDTDPQELVALIQRDVPELLQGVARKKGLSRGLGDMVKVRRNA